MCAFLTYRIINSNSYYRTKRLLFVMEADSVLCEVETNFQERSQNFENKLSASLCKSPPSARLSVRDSSVGRATRNGLDGPGIEFRWGRDFPHPSRPALGPPVQWVRGLSRGYTGRGVVLTTHTHLRTEVIKKGRAIPVLTLWASVVCYRENLYLYLFNCNFSKI